MKKIKPLSEFVDDTYGMNTLIEGSLKTNNSADAFEIFDKK